MEPTSNKDERSKEPLLRIMIEARREGGLSRREEDPKLIYKALNELKRALESAGYNDVDATVDTSIEPALASDDWQSVFEDWEPVGVCGIHSGKIMVCDPVYCSEREGEVVDAADVEAEYRTEKGTQLNFNTGEPGAGYVVRIDTDIVGPFVPVLVRMDKSTSARVASVRIDLLNEFGEALEVSDYASKLEFSNVERKHKAYYRVQR
jgi:hypothetical protein